VCGVSAQPDRKGKIVLSSQFNSKKTKIVATIGPASTTEDTIRKMIQKGLNVARINFSHGEHHEHGERIALIRRIAQEEGVVVGILCDIQGPKIRIGKIEGEGLRLETGDMVTLTLDKTANGANNVIALPHPEFVRDIKAGMQLLLDDGNLEFVVEEAGSQTLMSRVVIGGLLTSRKGVMAPKARLTLSAITEKDRADVEFALSPAAHADYIAMSFVRSADDIREMRWLMRHLGGDETAIISKIEKHEALENIEAIIAASDGIMVARGDLGIETPAEEVPYHQKRIIQLCNAASKPVITATQMLSSMVENPRPTRAEASDVYNAIVDGTDAVMLSNETAAGKYPVVAVETMANIANIAEQHIKQNRQQWDIRAQGDNREAAADAISESTYHISEALSPRAIITSTLTGYTTRRVARERPHTPIICVTPNETTYRRMALVWGVTPLLIPHFHSIDEMIQVIVQGTFEAGLVKRGDMVIIIAGVPFGIGGQTNLLKIHRVGEANEV
jgi:pyruvate kinase